MTPAAGNVILGVVVACLAALGVTAHTRVARGTGNLLHWLCVFGAALLLAGIVGQRAYPNDDEQATIQQEQSRGLPSTVHPGLWDAGIGLPFVTTVPVQCGAGATTSASCSQITVSRDAVHVTPLAIAGALIWIIGLALVLFFEHVPVVRRRTAALPAALAEDDAV